MPKKFGRKQESPYATQMADGKEPATDFPGAEFFYGLSTLFAENKHRSNEEMLDKMRQSVALLKRRASAAGLEAVRYVVTALVLELDHDASKDYFDQRSEAWANAVREDKALALALAEAHKKRRRRSLSTAASRRECDRVLAHAEETAAATTVGLIARGELVTSGALQEMLAVGRQALSRAIKSHRLFAFAGPSGEKFYPAFYADPEVDRRALEKVSKILGGLPAASKYFFLTSKSTWLKETPLEALRNGRLEEVIAEAVGFAER